MLISLSFKDLGGQVLSFADSTLECRECGNSFVWTAGEQSFYAEKGLLNQPARCPECRAQKRQSRAGNGMASNGVRVQHPVTCAECGTETTVPFIPRNDKPVYCSACFDKTRSASRS